MGLMDFAKDIGASLFASEEQAAEKISEHITSNNPGIEDLNVSVENGVATITCKASNRAAAEKTILMIGNVKGVSQVNYDIQEIENQSSIVIEKEVVSEVNDTAPAPSLEAAQSSEAVYYEIKSGDNLSKISKLFYGDPNQYKVIFEANREVIGDPDKIYPGQRIRIPQS